MVEQEVKEVRGLFDKGLIAGFYIMGGASVVVLSYVLNNLGDINYIPRSSVGPAFAEPNKLEAIVEDIDSDGVKEFYLQYDGIKYMIMKNGNFSEFDANGPVKGDYKICLKEFSVEPGRSINPRIKYAEEKK